MVNWFRNRDVDKSVLSGRPSSGTRVVQGRLDQRSGAFKDYVGPDGSKLRVMNPSVKREADRRASRVLEIGSAYDRSR